MNGPEFFSLHEEPDLLRFQPELAYINEAGLFFYEIAVQNYPCVPPQETDLYGYLHDTLVVETETEFFANHGSGSFTNGGLELPIRSTD